MTRIDLRATTEAALDREPRPAPAPAREDRRGGRRRVAVAAALVALLAAGAWWWAPVTARLGDGATAAFGAGARTAELAAYGEHGAHVLGYVDGDYTEVTVRVRNGALLPVTVRGARLSEEPLTLAPVLGVAAGERPLPVRLGRGEEVELELTVRFDHCDYYHERALEILPAVLVDVSVLGRPGTTEVTLDRPVLVRSPMIVDCPDRLLDRQARTRRGR